LFCLIRHPLIIAPFAAQRQALLTERLQFVHRPRASHVTMEPPQGAGEKRIGEPREEAGSFDRVHAFSAEPQRLHEQNLDKTIDDEIAAWSLGERLLDDQAYHALKPSRRRIGGLDMHKGRQQTAGWRDLPHPFPMITA
jgi:hypothetical protein